MASVRSCVSVKPAASPARYRSARVGAISLEPRRLSSGSAADGCSGRGVGCAASSSGRGDAVVGFVGDGGRTRMGRHQVVAMCSAGLEGVAAVASVPTSPALPERVKVVALMAAVMLLCNADRVVMSVAVVPLAAQHGWSSSFVGIVQSSFLWGYVFSSMVGGALADKYGGKKVMAGAAALWSLATFLTPWAASQSAVMLLAVRVLFGIAEGVAFPTMSTFLPKWFPTHERATAVGISMGGFHLGNVVSFLATPIIMSHIGLAGTFAFFASLGFVWLSVWLLNVESDPIDSRTISKSELQLILAGRSKSKVKGDKFPSLREVFSKAGMWAIIVANVINNWGYFVLLSWMPVYFKTVYDVNLKQAAWFSAIPWAVMALSGYVAGASADHLIKSGFSTIRVRKIMQSIGFIGPGVSLLCLRFAQTPSVAAVIMTAALGLSSCSQAGYFCNVQDIAPQYAGSLHGMTNGIGVVAAIVSTVGAGYFVQWLGSFQAFLTLTAVLYFSATVFFFFFLRGNRRNYRKNLTERTSRKEEITAQSFCNPETTTKRRTCRWRAAAASSFKPWIRRRPLADGKSPDLELHWSLHPAPAAPPSSSWNGVSFNFVNPDPPPRGSGRGMALPADPRTPGSEGGRRCAADLRRAPPREEERTCTKKTDEATSSMAPTAGKLTHPTLSTHARQRSPALPPPKRPAEGEGSTGSAARRWICKRRKKSPLSEQ